jgi:hypothetical protein
MGVQGIISPSAELDDARFDAIVGISRDAQPGPAATRDALLSTPGLSPRARRRRAALTLTALLGAGALIGATLLVTSGTLAFGTRADKLAGATSAMSDAAAPVDAAAHDAVFGTAANLMDGVTVLVSAPTSYDPGRKAVGADQAESLVYTVTVTNTSDVDRTPALAISASAGGTAATPITESAEGLTRPGSATIAAGETRTFRVAFSAASADTVVTVSGTAGSTALTFHS